MLTAQRDLIGRDSALAAAVERLGHSRLVTMVGPGGIGKTALARAAAAQVEASFERGCHMVDLSRCTSADEVEGAVAAQLGFQTFQVLLDTPVELPALVLVDNCEHVTAAAADVVAQVLAACTAPTVLATSRSPLHLPGETIVPVGPLETPTPGVDGQQAAAVRLFLARARDAGATVVDGDLEAVCELCRRLDGVPLAIEIAASRTRSMSPTEVLARLDEQLDLLSRPRWHGDPRHRSLRATIDWSYRLLDERAQVFFDRLGVLAGPFDAEMAHLVGYAGGDGLGPTLGLLDELVSASLLMAEREGTTTWYRLLGVLRSYAFEGLRRRGDVDATWVRFAGAATASALMAVARSPRWDVAMVGHADATQANLVSALRRCVDHDTDGDRALLLTAALWETVHRGHTEEVAELGHRALARWPTPTGPRWRQAAATVATASLLLGRHRDALACADHALAATATHAGGGPGDVLLERASALARLASGEGDTRPAFARAAAMARDAGDEATAVEIEIHHAEAAASAGDHDGALAQLQLCSAAARRLGSTHLDVYARTVEGHVRLLVDPDAAGAVIERALADARGMGFAAGILGNLCTVSMQRALTGRRAEAARAALDALDQLASIGAGALVRIALESVAMVLLHMGRPAWTDIAATAESLPPYPGVGGAVPELLPEGDGQRLLVREGVALARHELRQALRAEVGDDPVPPPGTGSHGPAVFSRNGDHWEVAFEGRSVHVLHTKGMADLAALLAQPGRELHCVELAGAAVEQATTGEVIDASARRAYEERVRQLQADLDQAEADHDIGRAERAREELDAVVDHLTAALGAAGRHRQSGSTAERARTAVTHRVRSAVRRINEAHPALGLHLRHSVRTGTYCCYRPEPAVDWLVVPK